MSWQGPNLCFWILTVMVLFSAVYATFTKSILRAAFGLFFTLFGMAGYYLLLGSDFVAVTQVIIYVGGILVLLMFGVLLTNRSYPQRDQHSLRSLVVLLFPALLLLGLLLILALKAPWPTILSVTEPPSSVRAIGRLLAGQYLGALLISGVTLLLCLIGAAYLVRRQER
jgi:NADH:ubiquinone oxidoreductase subunit 6 (subunit J)